MSSLRTKLSEIVRGDPRYAPEAYEFVYEALEYTQKQLGRPAFAEPGTELGPEHHATGRELVEGIRDLALQQFGLMARTVFRMWGIRGTGDFGEIVFNLVEANMMHKTDQDTRTDFQDVYDLDQALVQNYQIKLEED